MKRMLTPLVLAAALSIPLAPALAMDARPGPNAPVAAQDPAGDQETTPWARKNYPRAVRASDVRGAKIMPTEDREQLVLTTQFTELLTRKQAPAYQQFFSGKVRALNEKSSVRSFIYSLHPNGILEARVRYKDGRVRPCMNNSPLTNYSSEQTRLIVGRSCLPTGRVEFISGTFTEPTKGARDIASDLVRARGQL